VGVDKSCLYRRIPVEKALSPILAPRKLIAVNLLADKAAAFAMQSKRQACLYQA